MSEGSLSTDEEEEERELDGSEVRRSATVTSTVEQRSGHSLPSDYNKIGQATEEAQSSKREAFAESVRRQKAEKNALDAIRKVSLLLP